MRQLWRIEISQVMTIAMYVNLGDENAVTRLMRDAKKSSGIVTPSFASVLRIDNACYRPKINYAVIGTNTV